MARSSTIRRNGAAFALLSVVASITFSTLGVAPAAAASYVVTSGAASGPGTLRQAIADAVAAADTNAQITIDSNLVTTIAYAGTAARWCTR